MRNNYKTMLYGILTVIISLIITISYMHLWGTDFNVPLTGYRSDSLGVLLEASNYVKGGNVHYNVCYGAPKIYSYVYSIGDSSVPIPLIGFLTKIIGSVEAAINIHAILNSILLAIGMYWVCCRLKINEIISMILGISYACLPFFVFSCTTLLLIYSFCFYIPLFCYIVIDLMSKSSVEQQNKKSTICKTMFIIAVMLFVGLNSAYYAFFAMIILTFVGLYVLISIKSVEKVLLVVISCIAVGVGIAIYTLPNILYEINHELFNLLWNAGYYYWIWIAIGVVLFGIGIFFYKKIYPHITMKTIWIIVGCAIILAGFAYIVLKKYTNYIGVYEGRSLYAVELGALNIVYIALPVINNVFDSVNSELPLLIDLENENFSTLGILSGIGFFYSMLCIFQFGQERNRKDEIVKICGICNCFIVILAIKGGLASLVATYITTGIRNYGRIHIFIAVFSLISFGILIEKLFMRIRKFENIHLRKILYVCVSATVVFGLALSCPTDFIVGDSFGLVKYDQRKKEYDDWKVLMNNIENTVPEGSMILELPLSVENEYFGKLMERGRAYELLIPAIISKTTVWSYLGGWNTDISIEDDTEEFIETVRDAGFQGIYIDTLLYHDDSYVEQIESLENLIGTPIVCNEKRRYFFNLAEYEND